MEARLRNALAHGDRLLTGQRIGGARLVAEVIRGAAELPVPEPEALPRDPICLPGGAGNTTRGEGVQRGVGFAVGFKNTGFSEGSPTTTAPRASACSRMVEPKCIALRPRSGRATNVILQVAQTELGTADVVLAPLTTASVGSSGSASASRMTWMAAGAVQLARAAPRSFEEQERTEVAKSTSSGSIGTARRARSTRRRARPRG